MSEWAARFGWSTPTFLLAVIAVMQLLFVALLIALILVDRARRGRARGPDVAAARRIREEITGWLLAPTPQRMAGLRRALAAAPRDEALDELLVAASSRIPTARRAELAVGLRGERWLWQVLGWRGSRRWWRRLAAARAYGVVGLPDDAVEIARLLDDPHPAVQTAASTAVARVASPDLVARLLDQLPRSARVVRRFQFNTLREVWGVTVPVLRERLAGAHPPQALAVWVYLAAHLLDPGTIAEAVRLADHPDVRVRLAVAALLRQYFHPDAPLLLLRLLGDDDAAVRAEAARGLGALNATAQVPHLAAALEDGAWEVRFRAALSLAQLGEPGREVLRLARLGPDRYARDMAAMVGGLSVGGVLELAEG